MKQVLPAGAVLALLFLLYYVTSPYITVYRIQLAAEQRDGAALSEHVDFPAVRQSLKDQLNARLAAEMGAEELDDPLIAFGAAVGGRLGEKVVDAYVTPEGLSRILHREQPASGETGYSHDGQEAGAGSFRNTTSSYESPNRFTVSLQEPDSGGEIRLTLRRSGLTWKLSEIRLPM